MGNERIANAGKEFETTFREFLMGQEFNDHEAVIFTKMASHFLSDWSDAMAESLNLRIETVDDGGEEE